MQVDKNGDLEAASVFETRACCYLCHVKEFLILVRVGAMCGTEQSSVRVHEKTQGGKYRSPGHSPTRARARGSAWWRMALHARGCASLVRCTEG